MSKNENNAAPPWTIEFLRITDYHMNSEISINASGTGYDSYTNLFLTGAVTLPYTINAVQIKFVPDDQPLSKPSWQPPNLSCEKHISEWDTIFEIVNGGLITKKPGSDFTAQFIAELAQLNIILS